MVDRTNSVTEAIIDSVSSEIQTDPLELPPLYDAIDPGVLEEPSNPGIDEASSPSTQTLTFEYAGCEVRLDTDDCTALSDSNPSPQRDLQ